jgi:hypothetical protein
MLETPLYGKFQREDTRLVFGPPAPYTVLVRVCIGFGAFMVLYGLFCQATGRPSPIYPQWWAFIGILVVGAGCFAALSLQSIVFDLREKTYTRRQGPGILPRVTRGPTSNIDALVAISEPNARMMTNGVTYHLVLHWKGNVEPIMVLQQDTRQLVSGQPLGVGALQILQRGERYARAIGVPYFDNTNFASKNPVSIW